MWPITRSQWTQIAPLLDEAFDLPQERRIAWLARLGTSRPDLAETVELFLNVHHACTLTNFPQRGPLMRTVRRICRALPMRDKVLSPAASRPRIPKS